MISRPHALGKEVHFKDFWVVLKDNSWIIMSFFVVIVSTVAIVSFAKTPLYETKARVLIKTRMPSVIPTVSGIEEAVAPQTAYDAYTFFNSQRLIVESTSLSEYAIKRFPELLEHPQLKNSKQPAQVLRAKIRTEPIEHTNILDIYVVDIDAEWAAKIANYIADAYSTYNVETMRKATERIYGVLREKLDQVYGDYEASRQNMVGVAAEESIYNPKAYDQINTSYINTFSSAYSETQRERIARQTLLEQIAQVQKKGGSFLEIEQIANDDPIADLHREYTQMQVELMKISTQYRSGHPEIVAHKARMRELEGALNAEIRKFIERVKNEHQELMSKERSYFAELENTKKETADVYRKSTKYDALESQVKITEETYGVVLKKLVETEVLDGLRSEIINVLEYAMPPKAPFAPKVGTNIFFALLFSFFLSVGFIILKEYLNTSIRNPDDIERLGLPILSMVPHVAEGSNKSAAREAFNTMRTSLMFSRGETPAFRLLVTSSVPKEGKTSVSTNIGKTLASGGDRVILVDCDLRRPMLHNRFNVDRRFGGLTSYIMQPEGKPVDAFIQNVAPNLDVLPCGPIPPDPMKILSLPNLQELVEELSRRYRWVIIDSPPLIGLSDAVMLSRMMDGVCLVMRRNVLDRAAAERAVKLMKDVKASLLGVVFNDVDFRSAYYTRYYQYGGYYYYYSSPEEKKRSEVLPLVEQIRRRRKAHGGDSRAGGA